MRQTPLQIFLNGSMSTWKIAVNKQSGINFETDDDYCSIKFHNLFPAIQLKNNFNFAIRTRENGLFLHGKLRIKF